MEELPALERITDALEAVADIRSEQAHRSMGHSRSVIKFGAGKMYWTDANGDTIRRADLDGSNVEDLVTVYIPFFAAAVLAHDWPRQRQERFVGGLFAFDAFLLRVFGPILGWV